MALRRGAYTTLAAYKKTHVCQSAYALPNYNDNMRYIGMIKNIPHYKNYQDEVYLINSFNQYDYVADWLDEHKMLWTDYPQIWRLVTVNKKNYFFDIYDLDAYSYDFNKHIVYPVGLYCPKQKIITPNY